MQRFTLSPFAHVGRPVVAGCEPFLAAAIEPARVVTRSEALEAPRPGRLVEPLPGPLRDDDCAATLECADDPIDYLGRTCHVMKRNGCDRHIDPVRNRSTFELEALVVRFVGGLRVDANGVIAVRTQHWDEAAKPAAADVHDSYRRARQMSTYERPGGGKPSLAGCHPGILGPANCGAGPSRASHGLDRNKHLVI